MVCVCCANGGCTNPNAANYNPSATCDDGSCVTCCTAGKCRFGDSCKGPDCNDISGAYTGCCDSGCLPCGCPDPFFCFNDCHPSFAGGNFTATKCDGTTLIYYDCYSCPTAEYVSGAP
jgi:hypothetical protein